MKNRPMKNSHARSGGARAQAPAPARRSEIAPALGVARSCPERSRAPAAGKDASCSRGLGRAVRDLAEIALEADSRDAFARLSVEVIKKTLSMDATAIHHSATGVDIYSVGSCPQGRPLGTYLDEVSPEELRVALSGGAMLDSELFTPDRKDRLRVYTDYLRPEGIHGFCAKGWINSSGGFWLAAARAGRKIQYSPADLAGLDMLGSILAMGEALHAVGARSPEPSSRLPQDYARERGLTRAELQVAELVERGLSNDGIGLMLGRSKNTVRNQLAAAFAKLRVCTRTDLVAALRAGPAPSAGDSPRPRGALAKLFASEWERRASSQ
jgi:DNA-binding CsgD family transcriptional regulator